MKTGYGVLVSGAFKINMLSGTMGLRIIVQSAYQPMNSGIYLFLFFFLLDEEKFYKIN